MSAPRKVRTTTSSHRHRHHHTPRLASPCVCVRTLMKQRSRLCDHLALVDTGPCCYFEMVAHTAAAPYSRHAGAGAGASPPEGAHKHSTLNTNTPTTPFWWLPRVCAHRKSRKHKPGVHIDTKGHALSIGNGRTHPLSDIGKRAPLPAPRPAQLPVQAPKRVRAPTTHPLRARAPRCQTACATI